MRLEIIDIKPVLEVDEEKQKVTGELCEVSFVTRVTAAEFDKLKKKTKEWSIDVEVKNKKA